MNTIRGRLVFEANIITHNMSLELALCIEKCGWLKHKTIIDTLL